MHYVAQWLDACGRADGVEYIHLPVVNEIAGRFQMQTAKANKRLRTSAAAADSGEAALAPSS